MKNKTHWFILGSFPIISAAEIVTVLKLLPNEFDYSSDFLIVKDKVFDSSKMIKQLGGTIKIAQEIGIVDNENDLIEFLFKELSSCTGKITFGVSAFFNDQSVKKLVENVGISIKKKLKTEGHSARYIFKGTEVLSSVTVAKNNLIKKGAEFILRKEGSKFIIGKTLEVQPFDDWSKRDFGRPGRDNLSGMIPPKLARMMINLTDVSTDKVLLDPFCGSGTILSEAVLMGYKNIIGTDISDKAILQTKQNIEWLGLEKNEELKGYETNIFEADSQDISKVIDINSIDVIITEPYLGNPLKGKESKEYLLKQAEELKKLYVNSIKEFNKILKKEAKLMIIIPQFKFQNEWIKIDIKHEFNDLGFSIKSLFKTDKQNYNSLFYARQNQRVGREIILLTKHC